MRQKIIAIIKIHKSGALFVFLPERERWSWSKPLTPSAAPALFSARRERGIHLLGEGQFQRAR
jgi:hypothetical protein